MQSYLSGRPDSGHRPTPRASGTESPLAQVRVVEKSDHASHGRPEVECVKQGNRVTRILITCGCGERIEIDCVYPDEGGQ